MNFLVVRRKMKDAPHFRFRFAFGTGKRHGERALDRVRGEAKIFVTSGELTVKIDRELVSGTGRCVEIGGVDRHFRSKTDEADETNPKPFHFIIAPQKRCAPARKKTGFLFARLADSSQVEVLSPSIACPATTQDPIRRMEDFSSSYRFSGKRSRDRSIPGSCAPAANCRFFL